MKSLKHTASAVCRSIEPLENSTSRGRALATKRKTEKPGYVYVARLQAHCKVGASSNPKRRFKRHRNVYGQEIEFLHVFRCPTRALAFKIEAMAHEFLSNYRSNRKEWFLTKPDVATRAVADAATGVSTITEVPATHFLWNPIAN